MSTWRAEQAEVPGAPVTAGQALISLSLSFLLATVTFLEIALSPPSQDSAAEAAKWLHCPTSEESSLPTPWVGESLPLSGQKSCSYLCCE